MTVHVRSLINVEQTIDSVAIGPFALQERGKVTSALQTAADQHKVALSVEPGAPEDIRSFEEYVPLTGETISLPNYAQDVSIAPAGTIATLTLNMPAAPADGQDVRIAFGRAVTALTHQVASGSGHTLKGALTAATARGFGTWRFRAQGKVWHRFG